MARRCEVGLMFDAGAPARCAHLPGYAATIWVGLAGPAGTLRERLAPQGVELAATTPEEFAEIIKAEIPKWGKVLRDANGAPE